MKMMMGRAALAASVSLLALGGALAGGLTNTSQSSVFNGMAYAGFAAPGSESAATMFMNPATMTGFTRFTLDTNYTFGVPVTKMTGAFPGGALNPLNNLAGGRSGDAGVDYFVPATYVIYPLNDRLVFGVSLNTTYGNSTKPETLWRGSFLTNTSKLRVITATPSLAYRINNEWSVGVGLQLQYASARFVALPPGNLVGITHADGFGVGLTAGVTWTPTKTTQIGLGWRSFVDQRISGKYSLGGGVVDNGANGTLNLPNRVNLSIRQGINDKLDLLGSIEWQNYGRIGNAARINTFAGARNITFGYNDGWMFSVGGEYKYNRDLTLRAGIGYEISPVTDAVRAVSLPDNDRLWLSTGFSYKIMDRWDLNASYSFLHIKKASIAQPVPALLGGGTFVGQSKGHAHLLSLGLTSKWGDAPVREAAVVRKY